MKEKGIYTKQFFKEQEPTLDWNCKEIWRYSGYFGKIDELDKNLAGIFDSTIKQAEKTLIYKVCWQRFDISWNGENAVLPFECHSKKLFKCIEGCNEIVMFAATVGSGIDRLIKLNQRISPSRALILQGFGAERVEALCDLFCDKYEKKINKENLTCSRRFSPGYGDLPIETQKNFFELLEPEKKIAVSLGGSMLMSPSKSVTAIFGIKPIEKKENCSFETENKCSLCSKETCEYRKEDNK